MSLGPVRPRFKLSVPGTVDEQIERVQATVASEGDRFVAHVLGHHVDITVVRADRRWWSPCVQMEFRSPDGTTVVDGLVGPHPNLWTLYAFVNITIALAVGFGLMLALAQLTLGESAWALWSVPAGLVLLAAMYFISQLGRRLAAEQTRLLRELVERALQSTAG